MNFHSLKLFKSQIIRLKILFKESNNFGKRSLVGIIITPDLNCCHLFSYSFKM